MIAESRRLFLPRGSRVLSVTSLLASLWMVPLASAGPREFVIDPDHFGISFRVRHIGYADTLGMFLRASGRFVYDEETRTLHSARVVVDTGSVFSNHDKRDEHLRNADFLETAKFPTITFKSTKVEGGADGKVKITGDLTIKGVTKPVTLDGELTKEIKDPWGNQRRGFSATTKIDRRDFEVKYDPSGAGVGHELKIDVQSELVKAK